MSSDSRDGSMILRPGEIGLVERGAGVKTTPLVGRWNTQRGGLTTGVTAFEPGTAIALHSHNVEETVMVLEGEATVVVGEESHDLSAGDVTWVPAGVVHFFRNRGQGPMRIYWVYASRDVTRTLAATDETFEHLSEQDRRIAERTTT